MKSSITHNKSYIFKTAWNLKRRNLSLTFGYCLSIAWAREKSRVDELRQEEKKMIEKGFIFSSTPYAYTQGGYDTPAMQEAMCNYYANNMYNGD